MGKLKVFLFLFCVLSMNIHAQVAKENNDLNTIGWVEANTASQALANELQNLQVDSIKSRQTKLSLLMGTIATNKKLLQETMKNVSGFKKESKIYKRMVTVGANIMTHSEEAIESLSKSKLPNKATAIIKVGSLVTDAVSLGKMFSDIVTNGTVKNPIEDPNAMNSSGDGHNLLNRHERLNMAYSILKELTRIDRTLQRIIHISRFASANRLFRELDYVSFRNSLIAKHHMKDILGSWKKLKD